MPTQLNDEPALKYQNNHQESNLHSFLIDNGLVKDKQQADRLLLGIIGFCILVMIVTLWPESDVIELTPEEVNEAGSVSEIDNM